LLLAISAANRDDNAVVQLNAIFQFLLMLLSQTSWCL